MLGFLAPEEMDALTAEREDPSQLLAGEEPAPEFAALEDVTGRLAAILRIYWSVRDSTPSDAPIPLERVCFALDHYGLGDLSMVYGDVMRSIDNVYLRSVAQQRKIRAEERRDR